MCGIVGYIGKKKCLPILIDGLKKLEYRGYDSAGIAYLDKNEIKLTKSVGRIKNLEDETLEEGHITLSDSQASITINKKQILFHRLIALLFVENDDPENNNVVIYLDGDITNNVIVTNNIDNTKAGTYDIIYTVEDSSKNKFETKRTVEIKEKPIIKITPGTKYTGTGIPVLMYHFFLCPTNHKHLQC